MGWKGVKVWKGQGRNLLILLKFLENIGCNKKKKKKHCFLVYSRKVERGPHVWVETSELDFFFFFLWQQQVSWHQVMICETSLADHHYRHSILIEGFIQNSTLNDPTKVKIKPTSIVAKYCHSLWQPWQILVWKTKKK